MQEHKPWDILKTDKDKCGALLNACIGHCVVLAAVAEPYMPSLTAKVRSPAPLQADEQ